MAYPKSPRLELTHSAYALVLRILAYADLIGACRNHRPPNTGHAGACGRAAAASGWCPQWVSLCSRTGRHTLGPWEGLSYLHELSVVARCHPDVF